MDESEKEKIRQGAKALLDKFEGTLKSVKFKEKKKENKIGGFREEGQGKAGNADFRKRMFLNAPAKDEDTVIAEKKTW
ncbi:MAG: hypothetical protein WCK90_00720 [archaeon]